MSDRPTNHDSISHPGASSGRQLRQTFAVLISPVVAFGLLIYHACRSSAENPPEASLLRTVLLVHLVLLLLGIIFALGYFKQRKRGSQSIAQTMSVCPACGFYTTHALISWILYQSGSLLLTFFFDRFAVQNRQIYWYGMTALFVIWLFSQASFAWLNRRFRRIDRS